MIKKGQGFWHWFWVIFAIFAVATWVLWFFEIDARDLKWEAKKVLAAPGASDDPQNYGSQEPNLNFQPTSTVSQDNQISKCLEEFNKCKNIVMKKFDVIVGVNDYEKFENIEEAKEFYNTWSSGGFGGFILPSESIGENYPLVLIAWSMEGEYGKLPGVAACSDDEKLTDVSKASLGC